MKVLILGGNGMLGPWAVRAMKERHDILLTDINEPRAGYDGEYLELSVDDVDGVVKAAEGMDVIVNLSVLRPHRQLAFDVNTMGNYAMMVAAREHRIKRIINTGPHFQLVGMQYENWDHDLNPEMPPAPGTRLYAHTKALGQEICRVFSERHGIQVLTLLYYNMKHTWNLGGLEPGGPPYHQDMTPYSTAWTDCGTAIAAAVDVPEERLASRCETFFVFPDIPHRKFENEKIKRVLGWRPRYHVEGLWNKEWRTPPDNLTEAF
ncbi:MAG: NAD(P)-dependent oxidoreductase [Dehalococcoidia bacterium]|nr:NAD(P)-dependent oxidoreductase [Dehalococcoidia bacterium]